MVYQVRYNKYNNRRSEYNGYWYDSSFEASYAMELDIRKKTKDIKDWERQVRIPVRFNGFLITTYAMDFKIYHNDDSVEYIETKGFEDYAWKLRWKCVEAYLSKEEPDAILTVVKEKSRWQYIKKYKGRKK